jgi:hypothetical protein
VNDDTTRFKTKACTWPRHRAGQRENLRIMLQFVTARRAERTSRQSRCSEGTTDAFRKAKCGSKGGAFDGKGHAVLSARVNLRHTHHNGSASPLRGSHRFFVLHTPPQGVLTQFRGEMICSSDLWRRGKERGVTPCGRLCREAVCT